MGYVSFFENFVQIAILLLAWAVVIVSFFVLAITLFVTLVEFKISTLAGFVLVAFGFWNKSAFLAERVLGNVMGSGIKVLVLALVVGIGSTLFAEMRAALPPEPSIDDALTIMLALAHVDGGRTSLVFQSRRGSRPVRHNSGPVRLSARR